MLVLKTQVTTLFARNLAQTLVSLPLYDEK